jgi:hypothetical protein
MKTITRLGGVCLALAVSLFAGCGDPNGDDGNAPVPVAVTGVTLNETAKNLETGGTFDLTATIAPSNADTQTVMWTSSAPAIATVSGTGLTATVTAVAVGTATITVTTDDGGKTAQCAVTVALPRISATAVVKTQPYAGEGATSATDNFFELQNGQWTGTKELAGGAGAYTGTYGTARTTLLYIKKPMTAAYTFKAKITWPESSAGNILFGEFINPETAEGVRVGVISTSSTGTSFWDDRASGNTNATEPGYKGLAAIRVPGATVAGTVNANAYGWVNEYATLGQDSLSTLLGSPKPWAASGDNGPKTYPLEGFVPGVAHTLELSWDRTNGYVYKITVGESVTTITYPVVDAWGTFETRPEAEPIYPGIMIYNAGSITISKVELAWK